MLSEQAQEELLRIARESVTRAVHGEEASDVKSDLDELQAECGAFVTLKTDGQLRG